MKYRNIRKLIAYHPQLVEERFGPEPSLKEMINYYYDKELGVENGSKVYSTRYIKELKNYIKILYYDERKDLKEEK